MRQLYFSLVLFFPISCLGVLSGSVSAEPVSGADTLEVPSPGTLSHVNRQRLAPQINRIAKAYRVEPALVDAVISAESGYNPEAVSPDGAVGLMQLPARDGPGVRC